MHRSFSPANANVRSFDAVILPFRLVMPSGEAEFAEGRASAHYWARERQALGHKVRLILPRYVRPFVKTNKNDAADAEAICEAVTRPTMRFAPLSRAERQSVLMLHRARELLVRQRANQKGSFLHGDG